MWFRIANLVFSQPTVVGPFRVTNTHRVRLDHALSAGRASSMTYGNLVGDIREPIDAL